MTSRQRVLAALSGRPVDRIPLTPFLGGRHYEILCPDYPREGPDLWLRQIAYEVKFAKEVGLDFVKFFCPPYYEVKRSRVQVNVIEKDHTKITEYQTPIGTVSSVEQDTSVHGLPVYTRHLLETPDDFRIYEYVIEDIEYVPNFETALRFIEVVGEDGVLLSGGPSPPLKEMLLFLTGIVGCIYSLSDHRKALESLERVMHRKNLEYCRMMARAPMIVFMDGGVSGTNMISPQIFNEYCVDQSREYAQILHASDKLYCCLVAGESIGAILDGILESGVDSIWDYRPDVPGNPSIPELLNIFENRISVAGGLEIVNLFHCQPGEAASMTVEALKGVQSGDRFLLSGTGLIVDGTPKENFRAIAQTLAAFNAAQASTDGSTGR